MTDRDPEIHRRLLESLTDGVMVIDFDGSIRMANSTVYRMFGLNPEETLGRSFGEVFIEFDGFDTFTEAVLDAVAERRNEAHRVARVRVGENLRSLAVTVSCLASEGGPDSETEAVIVLVSDITEVRELRDNELRQAGVIKSQLEEIQVAYRDLEASNAELSAITRRVRRTRVAAVLFVLVLFSAIGSFYLGPIDVLGSTAATDVIPEDWDPGAAPTVTVVPQELRSTIALRGRLVPGRVVEIVSPLDGNVGAVHVSAGDRVTKGDLLADLDTGKIVEEVRRAEIEHIRARDRLEEIDDWDNSDEMARARNSLRRSRTALDDAELNLEKTAFLLEQGLVPASEHESARRQRDDRILDLEEAQRQMHAAEAKGSEDLRRIALLEARTAEERLREHEAKLALVEVRAPVSGVVIEPNDRDAKPLAKGRALTQGELMLRISETERLSVITHVNEVDVGKVGEGHKAWITGPGFPGLEIEGTVARVSSQAGNLSGRGGGPQFEVVIALGRLEAETLVKLRVGMSAHVTILVHYREDALLVPISAVRRMNGKTWLHVVAGAGEPPDMREVDVGLTTLDSVEVLSGVSPGERIVPFR